MLSSTEENYLKAIYKIAHKTERKNVSTNSISEELGTSPASVTDMIKKLGDKRLVHYEKYYGVELTKEGQFLSLNLIRKHRLWEVFLHEYLGFGWDQVHELAEQLEHIQSEDLVNRLDNFLGNPKYDPHGDPIPNAKGNFTFRIQNALHQLEQGETATMLGVSQHRPEFLQYLGTHHLFPGSKLSVLEKHSFDNSMHIIVENKHPMFISSETANHILVKKD